MTDRFQRIYALVGDAGYDRIRGATVMVVGVGAVGTFAAEALARTGIGRIILVDFDCVDVTNTNRQLVALNSTIGHKKVAVMSARIRDINPDADVVAIDTFFDATTELPYRPDFVIDAIDTLESKIALYKWCRVNDIQFAASMGAALKTDPTQVRQATIMKTSVCPLAARVRKRVRDENIGDFPVVFSVEAPHKDAAAPGRVFGSLVTVTGTFGLNLASIAIKSILSAK